ncbi:MULTISPECIES: CesT family type III secretion system chaperone [unclassified Rhizobacter]|uniref:CesT family type III secretion system chaperone n=1 Tax=unclassified Rhizobacter TaxID=2640088 RepID=UPI00138EEB0D|nr:MULTISPECIES: CesT family type III secretion system chaperone [unclassified Rhizobacter]
MSQLCKALPRDAAADVRERGLLSVDGHDVLIDLWSDDACRILVDLGLPPGGADSRFFRRLLALNLDAESDAVPVLGLEAASGHIVAIVQQPLEVLEQQNDGLACLIMRQLPEWVPHWRALLAHQAADVPADADALVAGWIEMRP